jgi:ketosteroid isomerase-like protein/mono/diheme cytochrome c family protein
MKTLKTLVVLGAVAGFVGLGILYSGLYNMGADNHHYKPVYWALETLRERSIAARSSRIEVPPLDDPNMLLAGGADYNEMCSGCHMKPGKKQSEISAGLYPQPPNLAMSAAAHGHAHSDADGDAKASAARQFWIIKHGVKASGMAAFGATHDDARIWAMVAFLQKLPTLDAAQYQILTARGDDDMGGMEGMDHGEAPAASGHDDHDEASEPAKDAHAGMAMPGMDMKPAAAVSASTPQAVVDAFQAALKSGDAKGAERWLAPDVLVYEGGGAERSRTEYAGHHLAGDIAFMQKSQIEKLKRSSGGDSDNAWVTTEYRIRGESSKGKPLDVASTETALLRKTAEGWRITHLHWSSQDYKSTP